MESFNQKVGVAKVCRWGCTAAIAAFVMQFLPNSHVVTMAQEYEGCFLINSSGQVVNLSKICGLNKVPAIDSADLAFIEDYKRLAKELPEDTRDNLLREIQTAAPQKIAIAKKICQGAKTGITLPEWRLRTITEAQKMDSNSKKKFMADMEVIIAIAPNHYCPEFKNP